MGYYVSNNDLKEIAIGACDVVIMGLVLIIAGLAYTLENYEPDAKLTFPPLWQAAYGQEQGQQPVVSIDLISLDVVKANCACLV
jgi:hypothetical protein